MGKVHRALAAALSIALAMPAEAHLNPNRSHAQLRAFKRLHTAVSARAAADFCPRPVPAGWSMMA